ncbi:hypothetical protein ETB97_001617 [Aspergillus alliaceus]|uniref:Uncharacterized protein n=1 Tax=Petromyces alliaceus TaxID=209559 RepID=A0A5N7C0B9_PETAA|nr:uncharacterized protein BDW43DRAFT_31002 [Aspergillus alliaceus]KAB8235353.1 hypothetical protein BDW43DRAFT_31002 [Aspergillus alliaceus]KAE8387542.1 hypothetical protein BDV23DRAFT_123461 [Aspergillus alliaceus]KAF5860398.1 hypothetical protein ETB97_001617 [Aspergillus burnettii]
MKLSVTALPLFLAASMAMPTPAQPNEIVRRFEGATLLDGIMKSGGASGMLKSVADGINLPLKPEDLKKGAKDTKGAKDAQGVKDAKQGN